MDEDLKEKETTLLKWTAPEFVYYKRGWKWFLSVFLVFFIVVGYSVYTKDWYIIFISTILLVFLFLSTKRVPGDVEYKITQVGIYINKKLYPFSDFHSFWLVLNADQKVLSLVFRKKYLPALNIIFYGVDPLTLKLTLAKYLPEQEERGESLADKLIRIFRIN